MASSVVAPVADPIIDTVHDFELQVLGIAEGVVDETNIQPLADSAFSLARNIFAVQRDLSRRVVDAVDNTITSVTTTVEGVVSGSSSGSNSSPQPKAKPAAAKAPAGKSA